MASRSLPKPASAAMQAAMAAFTKTLDMQTRAALSGQSDAALLKTNQHIRTSDTSNHAETVRLFRKVDAAGRQFHPSVQEDMNRRALSRGNIDWINAPATLAESDLIHSGMTLDDSQVAAIDTMLTNQLSCLIGAAGTGKTTILKQAIGKLIYGTNEVQPLGIRRLSGNQGPSIAAVTYTGVASSVVKEAMPQWMHPCVKTIHSLLEFKPVDIDGGGMRFEPARNALNKLEHDLIWVDEASMLGLDLWHKLLDAVHPDTIIILSGDLNQLVPVADTPFFPYVLAACLDPDSPWAIAELTTVHRQVGPGANRIIDAAHAVLSGSKPTFDQIQPGKPWRVAGVELPNQTEAAHSKILQTLMGLTKIKAVPEEGEELSSSFIYSPYSDLILTAGNGWSPDQKGAALQQSPINESLSRLIIPDDEESPVYLIDAGKVTRQYAVGDRIMCLRNEDQSVDDRVTNGTIGIILEIEENDEWSGDRMKFGTRTEVLAFQREQVEKMNMAREGRSALDGTATSDLESAFAAFSEVTDHIPASNEKREQQSSHILKIKYANGAVRTIKSALAVENTQLAYALTTHKAQGSQADTVFIVCHSACSFQLNREWLYTAITRAKKRLVIFYTDLGLRTAISKQQVYGKTLADKIRKYEQMLVKGDRVVTLIP